MECVRRGSGLRFNAAPLQGWEGALEARGTDECRQREEPLRKLYQARVMERIFDPSIGEVLKEFLKIH